MRPSSFLASCSGKPVMILTHAGADVDALGSAGALYFSLRKKSKPAIGIPEHLSLNAKKLASNLGIPYTLNPPNLNEYERLIVVDLNSGSMLGRLARDVKGFRGSVLVIDHHDRSGEKIAGSEIDFIDESSVSSAELVYSLLKKARIPIPANAATCIAAGIITDSANFLVADSNTFLVMADVMERSKKTYVDIISLFSLERDISEKIAALKAAKRCRIFGSAGRVITTTDVGAFEAGAATMLVKIGADVAFAGYIENSEAKISARANNSFVRHSGFDLPKHVFKRLSAEVQGSGGGHAAAAAFNSKADSIEPLLEKCAKFTHEFLRSLPGHSGAKLKEYK